MNILQIQYEVVLQLCVAVQNARWFTKRITYEKYEGYYFVICYNNQFVIC